MHAPNEARATFIDVLHNHVGRQPSRIAIRSLADAWDEPVCLTYAELDGQARLAASYLSQLADPGDRVVIFLPSGVDYAVAFLGCMYAGLIAVPAYSPETKGSGSAVRLVGIVRDCRPRLVITTTPGIEAVYELLAMCEPGPRVVVPAEWKSSSTDWTPPAVHRDTIAFLQYTSGSTSAPKGVMITHGNLVANEASIKAAFEFDRDDTVVSWLPLFHDMGLVGALLQPLFSGASVVLLSPQQFLERPARWLEAISRFGGTISGGPDFAFRLCTERVSEASLHGLDLSSWTLAFCGSEPIRAGTFDAFSNRFGAVGFDGRAAYACYGLAEATLIVTGATRGGGLQAVPFTQGDVVCCGRVQAAHEVRIVGAQGDGNTGEIWFSGPSVSPGYWNNTEATNATFTEVDGVRFLRTGDLGILREGCLYVTGRQKDLIIVRGQNIYPQDVEQLIEAEVEGVRRGRVAAFPIVSNGQEAIGVAAEVNRAMQRIISPDALASTISETIANVYQEPAKLVLLLQPGEIPKTSSGKLQRSRCYELWQSGELNLFASGGLAALTEKKEPAPQNESDTLPNLDEVIGIWKSVLQTRVVRPGDNFFLIGGNSITAVQVIARLRERLGIALELHHLFEAPTPIRLAGALQQSLAQPQASALAIPTRAGLSEARASHAQERLWFLWQLEPSSPAYNVSGAARLLGPLNEKALEAAIAQIVQRHESLRTSFCGGPDGTLQRVHQSYAPAIARDDLSALDEKIREAKAERLLDEEAATPFDLESGPPLRVRLVRCAPQNHRLIVTVHHIACDAWSMQLLIDEFVALYDSLVERAACALSELPIQYIDFAEWQRARLQAGETERQLAYWRQKLGSDHPVLELPADRPRRPDRSCLGDTYRLVIDPGLTAQLRSLSQAGQATMFMVLLAGFKTLIYRYTGQQQIRVGVPTANRTQSVLEDLIGVFVNTQVLSTTVDGHLRFDEILTRVKTTVLEAQAHQDLPFDQLVESLRPERCLTHNPLFEVMVNYLEVSRSRRVCHAGGLDIEIIRTRSRDIQFDLSLDIEKHEDDIDLIFTYAVDLFESATIARLGKHFERLLRAIADHPDTRLADVPLFDRDESVLVFDKWGRGEERAIDGRCLHELIAARSAECQDMVAVVCGDATLTYRQLNARANQLARYLRAKGVGPDILVGIAVERSIEMVIGLLGILKAGGAYVPLDPSYPARRLDVMVADSCVKLVLTQKRLLGMLPPFDGTPIKEIVPGRPNADSVPSAGRYVCLDRDWPAIEAYSDNDFEADVTPSNLAYCIYTSGSTGRPKAAANTHQAIVNRLDWMQGAYKLNSVDRVLHKTPFSFDVSVWELFLPLMYGAQLIVAPPNAHQDPRQISALIDAQQITMLHFVPSMLSAFIEADSGASHDSLRQVICSGEALRPDLQHAFLTRYGAHLDNLYGPTEAAIDVSFWRCRREQGKYNVPIGRPIWNTQLYVLDADLNAVPRGATGELYIGGIALARGYQNKPSLTAERFIPNPFPQRAGERLYCTGDLARWRPDGAIEYVGRIDHQVKIRGFRIELGEVEAQLLGHDDVREAVVLARNSASGKQLAAYVVASEDASRDLAERLREHLRVMLPDYMVPAHLVVLDALPLTPNGKLDRKALPELDMMTAYVAPRNAIEEKLVAIWQEVLGLERVGITDNFFALGGDSILSLQVIARALRRGIKLKPRLLFERQTIQALSSAVEIVAPVTDRPCTGNGRRSDGIVTAADLPLAGLEQDQLDRIPVRTEEIEDIYPLSPMQQGMLFHALHDPSAGHYVNQLSVTIDGLDVERFQDAWTTTTGHHVVHRTSFVWEGDIARPLQIVHKSKQPVIQRLDWRLNPAADADLTTFAAADRRRGFDLTQAPLQRLTLVQLGARKFRLIWTHHHLLIDGWSTARLLQEVFARYLGTPFDPGAGHYGDYIAWLSQQDTHASERFWTERLMTLEQPTLLANCVDGAGASYDKEPARTLGKRAHRIGPEVVSELRRFSQKECVTLNTLVQGAWALLLQQYCNQDIVVFGATVAGRPAALVGSETMLGLFINTIPIIAHPHPEQHVGDWLRRLQNANLELREHEHVPLYDIQRWVGRPGQSLFDTLIVFENYPMDEALQLRRSGDLVFGLIETHNPNSFPLTLNVLLDEGLQCTFVHDPARFSDTVIEHIIACWTNILLQFINAAETPVGAVRTQPPALRDMSIAAGRGAISPADIRCLHELIDAHVRGRPDSIAVIHEGTSLTYGELGARAETLARRLRAAGVGAGTLVSVAIARSDALVVGILGVLRAGGAYVPLDPSHPSERNKELLERNGIRLVIVNEHSLPVSFGDKVRIVLIGEQDEFHATPFERVTLHPSNAAYVIFTSGSTNRPKGVVVSHQAIVNYVTAISRELEFKTHLSMAMVSTPVADLGHTALFGALCNGATLHLIEQEAVLDAGRFADYMTRNSVDILKITPSHFAGLVEASSVKQAAPRHLLILGGERCDAALVARVRNETPCRVVNHYGPAEATVGVLVHAVAGERVESRIPLGRPLPNCRILVLSTGLEPVPIGAVGELYVTGAGLAGGYQGQPGATAERFVPNPFADDLGERMYRTGDLVRRSADGSLHFVGRADAQIKIRGFRIEAGEIEARLRACEGVDDAVVIEREIHDNSQLVAYVIPHRLNELSFWKLAAEVVEGLKDHLRSTLPDYMVPSHVVPLERFPLTANGKLDRAALPAPEMVISDSIEPRNPAEQILASIWQEVLGVPRIGVTENFFELGGDSILSLQIIARAKKQGIRITPKDVFEKPTIAALAALRQGADAPKQPVATASKGRVPLTPIQEWFFAQCVPDRHHWNQSILLHVRDVIRPAELEAALRAVIAHHDALNYSFRNEGKSWDVTIPDPVSVGRKSADVLWVREARTSAEATALFEEAQRSLSLDVGPLLRALLVQMQDGTQRLLLVVHHLVVDGVSWRILLDDLQQAYRSAVSGTAIVLPAKTTPFAVWAENLKSFAGEQRVLDELPFWLSQHEATESTGLPSDFASDNGSIGDVATVELALDRDQTGALVREAPSAFRTQIGDLLLSAWARVLCRWTGHGCIVLSVEGHGREDLFDGLDLTRTVGWFTTLYPVLLRPFVDQDAELDLNGSIEASIKAVKEQLRAIPNKGLGYGVLKYLSTRDVREQLAGHGTPDITFNYLGRFDSTFGDGGFLAPADEPGGASRDPQSELTPSLGIESSIYDGRLRVSINYSRRRYLRSTIDRLGASFEDELLAVVRHCVSEGVSGATPSDFPLAGLTQQQIDRLADPAQDIEDIYPLSPMQHGILFHVLRDPASALYVNQLCVRADGLDVARFRSAWAAVIGRHAILRTGFVWDNLPRPLQIVHKGVTDCFEELDWRERRAEEDEVLTFAAMDRERGFDLHRPPLQRLTVVRLADDAFYLIWTHHHLITDGWSSARQIEEIMARYSDQPVNDATGCYRDYIAWQARQDIDRSKRFWMERLRVLDHPTLLSDALRRTPAGMPGAQRLAESQVVVHQCSPAFTDRLRRFAQEQRITLNTVIEAAWLLLLHKCCGAETVVFGATVAGRPHDLSGSDAILGLFINTLPVIHRIEPSRNVADWLRSLQHDNVSRREHEHIPLYDIQRWAGMPGQVLFDTIIVFENYPIDEVLRRRVSNRLGFGKPEIIGGSHYPLTLVVNGRNDLVLSFSFKADMFDRQDVERLSVRLVSLLAALVEAPRVPLGMLDILTAQERTTVLDRWSRGRCVPSRSGGVPERMAAIAQQRPNDVAVVCEGVSLTYETLDQRSSYLSRQLKAAGVGPDIFVGLVAERSCEMVVALVAIWKAGGAYVPLDPAWPAARTAEIMHSAGITVVTGGPRPVPEPSGLEGVSFVPVDLACAAADARPSSEVNTSAAAYMIFTSGSTGQPKGVVVSHRALANYVDEIAELFRKSDIRQIAMMSTPAADLGHTALFGALSTGATLHLITTDRAFSRASLASYVRAHRVDAVKITPSHLAGLAGPQGLAEVLPTRLVVLGGEQCSRDLTVEIRRTSPSGVLINHYGPTETTVGALMCDVGTVPDAGPVPLGRPLRNMEVYILDHLLGLVPEGIVGELYIGGEGVARGYVGQAGLTAERFVPNPFSPRIGSRMYRTGDLGRWTLAGLIEFAGRADRQVKIRGFRVELAEIEARLRRDGAVRSAVVVVGCDRPILVGYVVLQESIASEEGRRAATARLTEYLRFHLPEQMVPAEIVVLDAIPLTPNGKVDIRALPRPERPVRAMVAPRDGVETMLAAIWQNVLGLDAVSVEDSFFELGGDSILSMRVIARAHEAGLSVSIRDLFECQTIAALAKAIGQSAPDGGDNVSAEAAREILREFL